MIGQLTGLARHVETDRCLIDVHGVGYLVSASTHTLGQLPRPPEVAQLVIETVVREDSIQLFGFVDAEEQSWFRMLTTVQGVGSRVALGILSVSRPVSLWHAVQAGDTMPFRQAAGVGPRLATRLLTELKTKVAKMPVPAGGESMPVTENVAVSQSPHIADDALMALEGLGFRRVESWPVINRIMAENSDVTLDQVIRFALKELAR